MAVDSSREAPQERFGPIEPLTLDMLREELDKLRGTLSEDTLMSHDRCLEICDDFIVDLGACINLSIAKYPDDKKIYQHAFDGLQDVINLSHGIKDDLVGADGQPRLMDDQESRTTAADRLIEVMEELATEIIRRETTRIEREPKRRPREGTPQ